MVESVNSELRSLTLRVRATRSTRSDCRVSRDLSGTSWIAGAISPPPPRNAIATPTWTRVCVVNSSSVQNPFIAGHLRAATATAFKIRTAGRRRSSTGCWALRSDNHLDAVSIGIVSAR